MKRASTNPPAFDHAMTLLLERLRLPPFQHSPEAYRLRFGNENPVYFVARGEDWLEILTDAGHIDNRHTDTMATALLELQLRQGTGPLLCIGLDKNSGKVSVRARLPLPGCHADDMLATVQALRAQTAAVRAVMEGKSTPTRPDRGNAASRDGSTLSRMSSLRGIAPIERE